MSSPNVEDVGFVVVSRNGGPRLGESLRSVLVFGRPTVYADSGSTDGSPERAAALGADVVRLDDSAPHTAARGRNAGWKRLLAVAPHVRFVQFVDGDTTLNEAWPLSAVATMRRDDALGAVCGHLREYNATSSALSRLFNMEWQGPIGPIVSTGGIAMMRVEALQRVGGFRDDLVAGEEADLCARLRAEGFKIERLDLMMGEHDSGIRRFGQWWRRTERVGHAYARAVAEGGPDADPRKRRQVVSAAVWAGAVPLCIIGIGVALAALLHHPIWIVAALGFILALYALLFARMFLASRRLQRSTPDSALYAAFCLIGKWPQLQGYLRFLIQR